jgi:hypothetical protein
MDDFGYENGFKNDATATEIDALKRTVKKFSEVANGAYEKDLNGLKDQLIAVKANFNKQMGRPFNGTEWPLLFAVNLGDEFTQPGAREGTVVTDKNQSNILKSIIAELDLKKPSVSTPWKLMAQIFEEYYKLT